MDLCGAICGYSEEYGILRLWVCYENLEYSIWEAIGP